jgi:hypothetical protein
MVNIGLLGFPLFLLAWLSIFSFTIEYAMYMAIFLVFSMTTVIVESFPMNLLMAVNFVYLSYLRRSRKELLAFDRSAAPFFPPRIPPMTAPAPAPTPIFVASSPFVASARCDTDSVRTSYCVPPTVNDVKRNAIIARPFTRPEPSTSVTAPATRVPAGHTSRPSTVTVRVNSALTGSPTILAPEPSALVKTSGSVVPAGIVTSRYCEPDEVPPVSSEAVVLQAAIATVPTSPRIRSFFISW